MSNVLERSSSIEAGTRVNFKFIIDFTSYFNEHYVDDENFLEIANRKASRFTARVWTMGNSWVIDDLKNGIKLEMEQFYKVDAGLFNMLQINVCSQH